MSPFFANYGYQPETQWIRPAASEANFTNPASEMLLARWRGIWEVLQENIHEAQQRMAKWYHAKAPDQPKFRVGDKVMIDARNFKTKRPSKKLDHKKIGPVRIVKLIGKRAVRVELPTSMKQHNVFNVTALEYTGKLLESPGDARNLIRPTRPRERSSGSSRVLPRLAPTGSAWNTWYFGRVTHRRKPHGNPGKTSREMTRWKRWLKVSIASIRVRSETPG
jgi:hypothetical protein